MINRISISTKIIGGFILFLSFMLAMVVWSSYKLNTADTKLALFTNEVVPLLIHNNNIDITVLEQEIVLEQYLHSIATDSSQKQHARLIASFRSLGKKVDRDIDTMLSRVQRCTRLTENRDDITVLADIKSILQQLQQHHTELETLQGRIAEIAGKADKKNLRTYMAQEIEDKINVIDTQLEENFESLTSFITRDSRDVLAAETGSHHFALIGALAAFILGTMLSPFFSRGIVRPLIRLTAGVKTIAGGEYGITLPVESGDEVGSLSESFNTMSQELKRNEKVKSLFGKYVDPRIVEDLIGRDGSDFRVEDGKREFTVYFSDIKSFTPLAELLTPGSLVTLLNKYFSTTAAPIRDNHGIIDKYIGDSIMAFWGEPFVGNRNKAHLACAATLEQYAQMGRLNAELPEILGFKKNLPELSFRVGIATGEVVAGNIGSEKSRSFTVIGDTVNLASRLESVNKQYGTSILVTGSTYAQAKDAYAFREIDRIIVVGKSEAVTIYELLGETGSLPPESEQLIKVYHEGLEHYYDQSWNRAQELFQICQTDNPQDGPSRVMLARIDELIKNPPREWRGVWELTKK